jgi:hypothetical protein
MTFGRACDIGRGRGAPPTPDELREYEEQRARFAAQWAPVLKKIAPQLRATAKAYPAAMRVYNAATKAERRRLDALPIVNVAKMAVRRRPTAPRGVVTRSRTRTTRRARSPSGRLSADADPHELAARLAGLIGEHGPRSGRWLRDALGVRKSTLLAALHSGSFIQVGGGRSATWDVAPEPTELERYREEVWKARRCGKLDGLEAIDLLIAPRPKVLEMLAEVVA